MFKNYITSKSRVVALGDEIGRGGEGIVYKISGSSNEVAKIYLEGKFSDRERKLEAMLLYPPHNSHPHLYSKTNICIAWPTEVVYDMETRKFSGFLMPFINESYNIFEIYNPGLRNFAVNWLYLHHVAQNFALALDTLHQAGHVMGDINQKNVLVGENALITLVDTDSFQIRDEQSNRIYRCEVGVGEYTSPELQGKNFSNEERNIYHDYFGLSVLVFQLLMQGFHPFTGAPKNPIKSVLASTYEDRIRSGVFPYFPNRNYSPPPSAPDFQSLHPELQKLFLRCFVDGHKKPLLRPTTEDWMVGLEKAKSDLVQCSSNSSHWYSRHSKKCSWCLFQEKRQPAYYSIPERQKKQLNWGKLLRVLLVSLSLFSYAVYCVLAYDEYSSEGLGDDGYSPAGLFYLSMIGGIVIAPLIAFTWVVVIFLVAIPMAAGKLLGLENSIIMEFSFTWSEFLYGLSAFNGFTISALSGNCLTWGLLPTINRLKDLTKNIKDYIYS